MADSSESMADSSESMADSSESMADSSESRADSQGCGPLWHAGQGEPFHRPRRESPKLDPQKEERNEKILTAKYHKVKRKKKITIPLRDFEVLCG
jgi:hypothetical protein